MQRVDVAMVPLLLRAAPEVFDAPVDLARMAAYLESRDHVMMVAIDGERVVAQCAAVIHRHVEKPSELHVDEVGVTPAWRMRGLGRRLIEAVLAIGRAEGCVGAWVVAEPDNAPANRLYASIEGAERADVALYTVLFGES